MISRSIVLGSLFALWSCSSDSVDLRDRTEAPIQESDVEGFSINRSAGVTRQPLKVQVSNLPIGASTANENVFRPLTTATNSLQNFARTLVPPSPDKPFNPNMFTFGDAVENALTAEVYLSVECQSSWVSTASRRRARNFSSFVSDNFSSFVNANRCDDVQLKDVFLGIFEITDSQQQQITQGLVDVDKIFQDLLQVGGEGAELANFNSARPVVVSDVNGKGRIQFQGKLKQNTNYLFAVTASVPTDQPRTLQTSVSWTIAKLAPPIPVGVKSNGNHYLIQPDGKFCYFGAQYAHIQDYVRLFPQFLKNDSQSFLRVDRDNGKVGDRLSTNGILDLYYTGTTLQPKGILDMGTNGNLPGATESGGENGHCPLLGVFKFHENGDSNNVVKAAFGSANGYYCQLTSFEDIYDYHQSLMFPNSLNDQTLANYRDRPDSAFHRIPINELTRNAKFLGACPATRPRPLSMFGKSGKIFFASGSDQNYCEVADADLPQYTSRISPVLLSANFRNAFVDNLRRENTILGSRETNGGMCPR